MFLVLWLWVAGSCRTAVLLVVDSMAITGYAGRVLRHGLMFRDTMVISSFPKPEYPLLENTPELALGVALLRYKHPLPAECSRSSLTFGNRRLCV